MKGIITIASLVILTFNIGAQNWSHVGPISTNQQPTNFGENKFETSQFNCITISPYNSSHMFASGKFAGLWETTDAGENWSFVNSNILGMTGVSDVVFIDEDRICVSSFHAQEFMKMDFSKHIGIYDFSQNTWSVLPLISTSSHRVNKIESYFDHNGLHILAASDLGLYRYTLINNQWTQILNIKAHTVDKYFYNNQYVISCVGTPSGNNSPNHVLFYTSMTTGSTWLSPVSIYTSNNSDVMQLSKMDKRVNSGSIDYFVNTDYNWIMLNRVTLNLSTQNLAYATLSSGLSGGRIGVGYDPVLNIIWFGGQRLNAYCESCIPTTRQSIRSSNHTKDGKIHDDIHSLKTVMVNDEYYLYVAHDGGIARAKLTNISSPITHFNLQFGTSDQNIVFEPMNYGLNVMLIYGFSGASLTPHHFAMGGHDIVQTDFYNAAQQRNVYTHETFENDGAHIDLFLNNLVVFDQNSHAFIPGYHVALVDFETGNFQHIKDNVKEYKLPLMPASGNLINTLISADMGSNNFEDVGNGFTSRNWIQDPYRPYRLFFIHHKQGLFQFDYINNVFVKKLDLAELNPCIPNVECWAGWGPQWRDYRGISFSPDSPNSFHIIMNGASDPEHPEKHPLIIKFIGENLDYTYGFNYTRTSPNGDPNWELISTSLWANINNLFPCNLSNNDIIDFDLVDIETSVINQNTIYVLLRHKDCSNAKIVKYESGVWTDYGNGLPSEGYSYRMIMDRMSNDCIYLATTSGIYYRKKDMTSFQPYMDSETPILRINQMEINYVENTLRIGTFGLGVWKSPLICPNQQSLTFNSTIPQAYHEANTIIVNAPSSIAQNHPTILRATNSITFNPGFNSSSSSQSGRYTQAFIHGCDTWGSSRYFGFDSGAPSYSDEISKDIEKQSYVIYPNPNNGIFSISSNHLNDVSLEIFTLSGTRVFADTFNDRRNLSMEINTVLPSGVYFARIFSKGEIITLKFVVV